MYSLSSMQHTLTACLPGDRTLLQSVASESQTLRGLDQQQLLANASKLRDVVAQRPGGMLSELRGGVWWPRSSGGGLLVRGLALVAEALRRYANMEYYPCQLHAGLVLSQGRIAEMQTGEGKSIVAAIPAFLHGLGGRGVHVATTNPYLAARDASLVSRVLGPLGVTVGVLPDSQLAAETRTAYRRDVTYGAGYQFGFDFLRDQLQTRRQPGPGRQARLRLNRDTLPPERLQRPLAYAVIDEIDSVLLDEASTPLVLSDAPGASVEDNAYYTAAQFAGGLMINRDFELLPPDGVVVLSSATETLATQQLRTSGLTLQRPWLNYIRQAIYARQVLRRDVNYIVRDGQVYLVDAYTGRISRDRSWSDGLQQAVQVKERIAVTADQRPVARITRQRFYQQYPLLAGMTGTARGNQAEFQRVYRLDVRSIDTHRPSRQTRLPTRFFANMDAKLRAIVADTLNRHTKQQPVLIGTRTIAASRQLSAKLREADVSHVVLNGVQDADEAEIIAAAGQPAAVTIATNMAGRGTDIQVAPQALAAGGLHVLATEHDVSARVDRQLIGRSARQGQPGSCQFIVSADDHLFAQHWPALARRIRQSADQTGESRGWFERQVQLLQRRLERQQQQRRRELLDRDDWTAQMLETLAPRS